MCRGGLVKAVEISDEEDDLFPDISGTMNESQREAVATVVSKKFEKGFFVIQGPPGCGSKYLVLTIDDMINAYLILSF